MRTFFKWDEPSRIDDALEKESEAATQLRAWNKEIDTRDRRQCRACGRKADADGVGLTKRAHRHHIKYRSAGGGDDPANRLLLCPGCHSDEHRKRLRIESSSGVEPIDANEGLTFFRKNIEGEWYLSRREIAPHVVEKD